MNEKKESNLPHWDAEETHPEIIDSLKIAFREVRDPEIGMDLIQLGLIRNVTISEDKASVVMILTTPYCPYAPMLMESARKKAEGVTGVPTEITYGRDVWDQSMMEDDTSISWGLF